MIAGLGDQDAAGVGQAGGIVAVQGVGFFPEVEGFDILVVGFDGAVGRHVLHPELFALVDVEGAAEGGLKEGEELGAVRAVLVAVIGVAGDGAGVVVVFAEDAVPAVVFRHGFLPFGDVASEGLDGPWVQREAGFAGFVVDVDNVHDEDHVELPRAAFDGSEDFVHVADPGHLAYSDGVVLG